MKKLVYKLWKVMVAVALMMTMFPLTTSNTHAAEEDDTQRARITWMSAQAHNESSAIYKYFHPENNQTRKSLDSTGVNFASGVWDEMEQAGFSRVGTWRIWENKSNHTYDIYYSYEDINQYVSGSFMPNVMKYSEANKEWLMGNCEVSNPTTSTDSGNVLKPAEMIAYDTVTFTLSEELIQEGYQLSSALEDTTQSQISDQGRVLLKNVYINSNPSAVTQFPTVYDGNGTPMDIAYTYGNENITTTMLINGIWQPIAIDETRTYGAGSIFTAEKRLLTITYQNDDVTTFETITAGMNATGVAAEKAETEDMLYTFNYWANADGSIASLENLHDDMIVYANYLETPKYNVTFMNGETVVEDQGKILSGSTITLANAPYKDVLHTEDEKNTYEISYTFAGWAVDGNLIDENYIIQQPTILEAQFDEHVVTTPKLVSDPSNPILPLLPDVEDPVMNENPAHNENTVVNENPAVEETPIVKGTPVETRDVDPILIPSFVTTLTTAPTVYNSEEIKDETTTETIKDEATAYQDKARTETIANDETPLAKPSESFNWTAIGMLAGATLFGFFILLLWRRHKEEEEEQA